MNIKKITFAIIFLFLLLIVAISIGNDKIIDIVSISGFFIIILCLLKIISNEFKKQNEIVTWKINLLHAALSSLQDNVTIIDNDFRIIYTNGSILNLDCEEAIGTNLLDVYKDNLVKNKIETIFKEVINTKIEKRFVVTIDKDILFYCSPLLDVNDNCIGITILFANFIKDNSIIRIN